MAAIRSGILFLVMCTLPATANAWCGLFSPCGSPSWIGLSLALPVPRLPHLHTFAHHSCRSPGCGAGQCGLGTGFGGSGTGFGYGAGGCSSCGPSLPPPIHSAPTTMSPPPLTVPSACNSCAIPMAQTQYVPQQTISYRDVPQIQYRQEAYTAAVPVTTYQQVTRYRSVPYQTVARIPQVSTQYVPQQRISYVTPAPSIAAAPCLPGLSSSIYHAAPAAGLPYAPSPQAAGVPEYPLVTPQQPQASSQWQTIPQRQVVQQDAGIERMGGLSASYRRGPQRSAFQPAPSAATAWQSRWLR